MADDARREDLDVDEVDILYIIACNIGFETSFDS